MEPLNKTADLSALRIERADGPGARRFLFPALGSIVFFVIVPVYHVFEKLKIGRFFISYICLIGFFPYVFLIFAK